MMRPAKSSAKCDNLASPRNACARTRWSVPVINARNSARPISEDAPVTRVSSAPMEPNPDGALGNGGTIFLTNPSPDFKALESCVHINDFDLNIEDVTDETR